MGKLIFAVVLCALAVFAIVKADAAGRAMNEMATFQGKKDECEMLASLAERTASLRNNDVQWDVYVDWLQNSLNEAIATPESFIKTKADADWVVNAMKQVYTEKNLQPGESAMRVYSACLQSSV